MRDPVVATRSRDTGNRLFQKSFPGGRLVMTGVNFAIGLRSTPVLYLFLDEVDGYPVALAIQRIVTLQGAAQDSHGLDVDSEGPFPYRGGLRRIGPPLPPCALPS